jgi:hypothetical protein
MKNHKSAFKFIPGYGKRYAINKEGFVKRVSRTIITKSNVLVCYDQKPIATRINKRTGYPEVKLTKPDGSYGNQFIHKLVAITFIPNPENKTMVNHKNGNKLDYNVKNLEWVSPSENCKHAVQNKLMHPFKKAPVVDICTGIKYSSIKHASESTGIAYVKLKELLKNPEDCPCLRRA